MLSYTRLEYTGLDQTRLDWAEHGLPLPPADCRTWTVQTGDFLYAISDNTTADVDEIAALNRIDKNRALMPGQVCAAAYLGSWGIVAAATSSVRVHVRRVRCVLC